MLHVYINACVTCTQYISSYSAEAIVTKAYVCHNMYMTSEVHIYR